MNKKVQEIDLNTVRIARDYAVVKVYSLLRKATKILGEDGKRIELDVTHDPNRYTQTNGIVVNLPGDFSGVPIAQNAKGLPKYYEYPEPEWKRTCDILPEVRIGDKVYFHWSCIAPPSHKPWESFGQNYLGSLKEKHGDKEVTAYYFKIKYELIFCAIRYIPANAGTEKWDWQKEPLLQKVERSADNSDDIELSCLGELYRDNDNLYCKQIIMIGSYVFIEPNMETWEDIQHPVQAVGADGKLLTDAGGNPIYKPKSEWLYTKANPGEKSLQGWVRYIGNPLIGDERLVEVGDYVHFINKATAKVEFEGKEYFRMRQRFILGIAITEDETE